MKMLPSLIAAVVLSVSMGPSAAAQRITIQADAYQQRFEGAGTSFGLFLGHHYSMDAADQDQAVRWIADDLNLAHLQDYPDGDKTPENDPDYFDRRANYVKAVRAYRPGAQFALVGNIFPDDLRTDQVVDGQIYRVLDADDPEIYDKLAAWYLELFQAFHDRGVRVDILNVVNEPDLAGCGPNQCRAYQYGLDGDTKRAVAEIFERAVPAFKAMLADPATNPGGIPVPRIMGPSTISPNGALDYIRYFKTERPAAWAQIDIVATHQYLNGVRGDLIRAIQQELDGRAFYQSETHASKRGGQADNLGTLPITAAHRTALSLHLLFGAAVNFGVEAWYYFQTNYPNPPDPPRADDFNPGGLLSIPFNTADPTPYKHYYAFRQLTSAQPDSSFVLEYAPEFGRRANLVAFRKPGDDTVYIHVLNATGASVPITVAVEDATGMRGLTGYSVRVTDAARDDEQIADVVFDQEAEAITYEMGPYSVNTLALALGGTVTSAEPPAEVPTGVVLAQNYPNPFNPTTTIRYELPAPGHVTLTVADVLGAEVATLVDERQAAGTHRAVLDASALASGVYVYTMRVGGRATSRRMVVLR